MNEISVTTVAARCFLRQVLNIVPWMRANDLSIDLQARSARKDVSLRLLKDLTVGVCGESLKQPVYQYAKGIDAGASVPSDTGIVSVLLGLNPRAKGTEIGLMMWPHRDLFLPTRKSDRDDNHAIQSICSAIDLNFLRIFGMRPGWISREQFEGSYKAK